MSKFLVVSKLISPIEGVRADIAVEGPAILIIFNLPLVQVAALVVFVVAQT